MAATEPASSAEQRARWIGVAGKLAERKAVRRHQPGERIWPEDVLHVVIQRVAGAVVDDIGGPGGLALGVARLDQLRVAVVVADDALAADRSAAHPVRVAVYRTGDLAAGPQSAAHQRPVVPVAREIVDRAALPLVAAIAGDRSSARKVNRTMAAVVKRGDVDRRVEDQHVVHLPVEVSARIRVPADLGSAQPRQR